MIKNIAISRRKVFLRQHTDIMKQYKSELSREILSININREIMLSYILIVIDVILLGIDAYTSKLWTINRHIFSRFSYFHAALLLIPAMFIFLIHILKKIFVYYIPCYKVLHLMLITLVLSISSSIAVSNEFIGKLPFTYLIAMFCISSTVFLELPERCITYGLPYIIYLVSILNLSNDPYQLIGNSFFYTLLVILAFAISRINYNSYIDSFINEKIIIQKNIELDIMNKSIQEALKEKTQELNETVAYEKIRSAFFANISHELRTPVSVIFSAEQMLTLLLKKYNLFMEQRDIRQYMTIIKQNCFRLIRLIGNFIDITKIDAGYLQVNLRNCDIIKVVEDIALSVAKYIEQKEITLIFDTEVEESTIACDPDKIERIILNLLSNAVKFTPKGGYIYINIFDREESIEIHVKDTGIGIPEKMRESIFERFVQVDKTISRNREGSGIGLSLVKSLVELHQGNISLLSEEGKGSEFIITLPVRLVEQDDYADDFDLVNQSKNVEKINIEFSDIYD